ncbi:GNAT family N-acetyltransferase [Bradyrhizobium sp. NAS80.1]|uniref:GNAT family N-acetyltransferase n=1 Tax=Bradyrhizobium sp. NAS80.1 TaxID=1680159 RepID=UPI000A042AB7|nr:GNAT family N-acetyltransferase [Bradyrhizobium sp. NAS80.1]
MSSELTLRDFGPNDRRRCALILAEAGQQVFFWAEWPSFDDDKFNQVTAEETIYVAEEAGIVVGFVTVYEPDDFLHHLYIHPTASRRGIGTALLNLALHRHGGYLKLKCQARNTSARAFYRRAGWIEDLDIGGTDELGGWLFIRSPAAGPTM